MQWPSKEQDKNNPGVMKLFSVKPLNIDHNDKRVSDMVASAMWHFISEQISSALDIPFICQHQKVASGGDTHQSFVIRDDRHRFFVKVHPLEKHRPLQCEADGLTALGNVEGISVPKVIICGELQEENTSLEYLVLSHLRFQSKKAASDDFALGEMLASLHQAGGYTRYGWHEDNFIGASTQQNGWYDNWADFFARRRIGSMLERLACQGVTLTNNNELVDKVRAVLASHQPAPSLLHGDLWSGNAGVTARGPVIFDPAVYVGDAETDLAMTDLFGGFSSAFYDGYQSRSPIAKDFTTRKPIYQLYHILNHALLFGGGYSSQAKSLIATIQTLD